MTSALGDTTSPLSYSTISHVFSSSQTLLSQYAFLNFPVHGSSYALPGTHYLHRIFHLRSPRTRKKVSSGSNNNGEGLAGAKHLAHFKL